MRSQLRRAMAALNLPALLTEAQQRTSSAGSLNVAAAPSLAAGLQARWFKGGQLAGGVGSCGITAAEAATSASGDQAGPGEEGDLGDLHPGMSVEEEEEDEVEHYSFRGHVKRRRLRPHPEAELRLDEEPSPGEEAPGEEAFKEAGPLLPPEEEEEDVESDTELEPTARK